MMSYLPRYLGTYGEAEVQQDNKTRTNILFKDLSQSIAENLPKLVLYCNFAKRHPSMVLLV